jgi:hypothetical protein
MRKLAPGAASDKFSLPPLIQPSVLDFTPMLGVW